MNEPDYNYYDDDFSLDQAEGYVLLLQIEAASFAYAVTQGSRLLAWGSGHPLDELTNPDELRDLLTAKYKQVITGVPALSFTLVPEGVYSDAHIGLLARLLNVQADEKVFVQELDTENRVVYKVSNGTVAAAEKFELNNSVFGLKGWIKAIANNNPNDDTLYLELNENKVNFLYYNQSKLRFFNSFEFYNADELTYYTAFVAEQLKLQPGSIHLNLSGKINNDDANFKRLAEFFKHVELNTVQLLQLPVSVKAQHILSLSALTLCG
ncbi:hypothetical protein GCM10023149_11690 [Mucilaginibacter gynuensis]|uniref:DUF3822 family protein n=1 Tax=Mucilaginibacter gynuensis TaxID=1302236 RepID=A0ABP8G162_9SPHI